jgi:hypothetical protein
MPNSPLPATVPFVGALAGFGDAPALVDGERVVGFRELAQLLAAVGAQLGPIRRLVLIEAAPTLPSVIAYLGALAAGHPVLLVPPADEPDQPRDEAPGEPWWAGYDPDVTVQRGDGWAIRARRHGTAH